MTKNEVVGEQQRADRDTRVCDIERGPMIVAGVYDDEIDNVAKADAIGQVTEDAREQQRTSSEDTIVVTWRPHKIIKDRDRGAGSDSTSENTCR